MNRVRVGLVGAGAVASSVHLPILTRRSDLFEVVALADLNLNATHVLADRFGISRDNCFDSPMKLIASGSIDAIMVLNSGSHAEVVVSALNAGLNVFCEKPLAYARREMKEIEAALKSSGKSLMIGYMKTFDSAVIAARKAITSRPRTVDVLVLHPSGDSQLVTSELSVDLPQSPAGLNEIFSKVKNEIQVEALGEAAAKSFGDLVIGIDSDERIKEMKGDGRPFHTEGQRVFNLMQIRDVDKIVVFDSDDSLRNHLKTYQPDIFVIGDEYMYKPIIGGESAKEIKFFGKLDGFSTTKLLDDE